MNDEKILVAHSPTCVEHIADDKKIHVIDNAMPQHVVDNWIDFYENKASFRRMSPEYRGDPDTDYWLSMIIDLKNRYQIFDIDSWMIPLITQYNPRCGEKDFMRSYLNMCTTGDNMKGHRDTPDVEYSDDEFFVVSLIFMNPYVKDPQDSGLEIEGGLYVENVFNRMIIFDGRLWHRAHTPTDRLIRLTMYNNHSHTKASWFR